jgi:CheY-like chemotaxis protein
MEQAWEKAGLPNALYIVRDGQEALDFLSGEGLFVDRAVHPMPGLVLLDLKLRRFHGLQVLQWIREQPTTRALRVIILSSSNQERDTAKALGITDYWLKSAEPGVLFKMVASLKGSLL